MDRRGPLKFSQRRGILARRQNARVSIGRQDGQAVGRRLGHGAGHARGPLGWGQRRGLLARWQDARVGIGRH